MHQSRDVFFLTSWLEVLLLKKSFLRTFTSTKDQGQSDDQCPEMTSLGWEDVSSLWWTATGVSEATSSAVKTHSFHLIYSCLNLRPVKPVAWKGNTHNLPFHHTISNATKSWTLPTLVQNMRHPLGLLHTGVCHGLVPFTKGIKPDIKYQVYQASLTKYSSAVTPTLGTVLQRQLLL